jgi:hypothetical protein
MQARTVMFRIKGWAAGYASRSGRADLAALSTPILIIPSVIIVVQAAHAAATSGRRARSALHRERQLVRGWGRGRGWGRSLFVFIVNLPESRREGE